MYLNLNFFKLKMNYFTFYVTFYVELSIKDSFFKLGERQVNKSVRNHRQVLSLGRTLHILQQPNHKTNPFIISLFEFNTHNLFTSATAFINVSGFILFFSPKEIYLKKLQDSFSPARAGSRTGDSRITNWSLRKLFPGQRLLNLLKKCSPKWKKATITLHPSSSAFTSSIPPLLSWHALKMDQVLIAVTLSLPSFWCHTIRVTRVSVSTAVTADSCREGGARPHHSCPR